MPTPPLPLLHQLLDGVHIPIHPASLSATPPSLLLLILEALLDTRLPLPLPVRRCTTQSDELAVVKCILGVLADDVLGLDLSAVDPRRVVNGEEAEMAVIIMALVVMAKRNGLRLTFPLPNERDDWLREIFDSTELPEPILPDVSLSPSLQQSVEADVFTSVLGERVSPSKRATTLNTITTDGAETPSKTYNRRTVMQQIMDEFGLGDPS